MANMIPLFVWQCHDDHDAQCSMLESLPVGRAHHAVAFLGSPPEQAGPLGGLPHMVLTVASSATSVYCIHHIQYICRIVACKNLWIPLHQKDSQNDFAVEVQ